MKVLSLYIDNFGKLSDYSYDFSSNLNTIYEENGWGKTTLTIFIKSMLYGLNKQERHHYTPWKNLTSFGGYLTLEVGGKEYRIERTFNPKKAALDTFKIYNLSTNKETKKYGSNLGETILNLNETSFERSIYIPQKDLEEGFGSDIEAKLANLIGGTDDSQTFEEACEILTSKMKEIRLNSKKGAIIDRKKELANTQAEIDDCNHKIDGIVLIRQNIDEQNEELQKLLIEKKEVNKKIINYSKNQEKQAKLSICKKYQDDINEISDSIRVNSEIFNNIEVTEDMINEYRNKNKELINFKTEYALQKRDTKISDRLKTLEEKLSGESFPSEEEIIVIRQKIEKLNNIKGVIALHDVAPEKKKPILGIVFTILSTIILLVGLGLLLLSFFGQKILGTINPDGVQIAGIIVMVVSALGYIAGLAGFISTASKNQPTTIDSVKAYDYELRQIEGEIREFFNKFHLYSNDYSNNLFIVRNNSSRYYDALEEYKELNNAKKTLERKILSYESEIEKFLTQFKTTATTKEERIGELSTHLRRKKSAEAKLIQAEITLKQFKAINELDLLEEQTDSINDLNAKIIEIDDKIALINEQKTTYSNKIIEFESDIAKCDDLSILLANLETEIRRLEKEYEILELTYSFLTNSQNSLLEKYVQPMKQSVNKYVSQLLNNNDYNIDINFKFQFLTNEGAKSLDLYSRGLQELISLCMRLALIDCLYPNEKPFVVLDDPFVNFDDQKLALCKNLIKTISNDYQIIYFTCHDSRKIS